MGYPNVYLAELPEEQEALNARYTEVVACADRRKALEALQMFEAAVKKSSAVVSMSSERFRSMAVNQNELYSNYDQVVRAGTRRPAIAKNDQTRRAVDGKLWGTAAPDIRYAALSLDGRGLRSYGDCYVELKESFIAHRTSVLEENSFDFIKDLTMLADCPLGYRSNWHDRYRVAVAKCGDDIIQSTSASEFPSFLLTAGDSRANDKFVEVHIHGGFDFAACSSVVVANVPRTKADKVGLKVARRYADAANLKWTDE